MPLYEYECDAQHHRFEVIQKFSDPPIEQCPTCGSPVRKLVAAPAFQLKGTGWYITDYAKKDSGGSKSESKDSTASSDKTEKSDSAGKSDSATKTESSSTPAPAASDKSS
jgi:putative FmdB family regulatory protein